jgi:hypothetical protein
MITGVLSDVHIYQIRFRTKTERLNNLFPFSAQKRHIRQRCNTEIKVRVSLVITLSYMRYAIRQPFCVCVDPALSPVGIRITTHQKPLKSEPALE